VECLIAYPEIDQMPLEFSDPIQTLLPKKWSRNRPKGFFFGRKGIWDETGRRWDETGRIGDEWAAGGTNGQQLGRMGSSWDQTARLSSDIRGRRGRRGS